MTSKDIYNRLRSKYGRYSIANIYYYRWESDIIVITESDYIWEIEIKISRSDFFADYKKKTPVFRKSGDFFVPVQTISKHEAIEKKLVKIPNRFYFATPGGLVDKSELPEHAGLIEIISGGIYETKKAPLLHREKEINYEKLFQVMYYRHNQLYIDNKHNQI